MTMENLTTDVISRCRGALVGLACGDALGTTLEFKAPRSFQPIDDMVGGGPFGLEPGQWTDDTSMALCLAASLTSCGRCDPVDQLQRYVAWRDNGYMSVNGRCFDIGNTVASALRRFENTGKAVSGSTDEASSGNGALMRMAPVGIFNCGSLKQARKQALLSTITTHASELCFYASDCFACLLGSALEGDFKPDALHALSVLQLEQRYRPEIVAIVKGSFVEKQPPEIRGSGFVVESLEAAIWALHHHDDFESGALAAANLGDDADTTAAIYGQLAGAFYGLEAIPLRWQETLAWRQQLINFADVLLLNASLKDIRSMAAACETTARTKNVDALARYLAAEGSVWHIPDYRTYGEQYGPRKSYALTGLIETAAVCTAYSAGETFIGGFRDAQIPDDSTQTFFEIVGARFRSFADFVESGAMC